MQVTQLLILLFFLYKETIYLLLYWEEKLIFGHNKQKLNMGWNKIEIQWSHISERKWKLSEFSQTRQWLWGIISSQNEIIHIISLIDKVSSMGRTGRMVKIITKLLKGLDSHTFLKKKNIYVGKRKERIWRRRKFLYHAKFTFNLLR